MNSDTRLSRTAPNVEWPVGGTFRVVGPLTRDELGAFALVSRNHAGEPHTMPLAYDLESLRRWIVSVRNGDECGICAYEDYPCAACHDAEVRRDLEVDYVADIVAGVLADHGIDAELRPYRA